MKVVEGGVEEQTVSASFLSRFCVLLRCASDRRSRRQKQVLANLSEVVKASGCGLENVVKTTVCESRHLLD